MTHRHCARALAEAIFGRDPHLQMRAMRRPVRKVLTAILALFLFPLAIHAVLYSAKDRPGSFFQADWSSTGMLPAAGTDRDARLLVFTGRTGRWKGIFAVH